MFLKAVDHSLPDAGSYGSSLSLPPDINHKELFSRLLLCFVDGGGGIALGRRAGAGACNQTCVP